MAQWRLHAAGSVALLMTVGACSGAGTDPASTGQEAVAAAPVAPTTPQENGLPHAASGQALVMVEGGEVTAHYAEASARAGTRSGTVPLTLDVGFFAADATGRDLSVAFLGETIRVTGGEGRLPNGQTVRLFVDPEGIGAHVASLQLASYAALPTPAPDMPENAEAHYIIGFLTDPAEIDARLSGGVTYTGEIIANGQVMIDDVAAGDPTETEADGTMTVVVNFLGNAVSGTLDASYAVGPESVDVALTLPNTPFGGNGFTADLTCADTTGCISNSSIIGGFYGPAGAEIGGAMALDTTQDINGAAYRFTGAGSFVIAPSSQ